MQDALTISPLGDGALLVSFGNEMDADVNANVLQLFHQLKGRWPFVLDLVPAYSSLAVYYDGFALHTKEKSAFETLKELLRPLLQQLPKKEGTGGRNMRIPVCYATPFAPDLEELAAQKNLSPADVIQLHTSRSYRVYMIGFLPGFPYMGKVDSRLATGRRSSPRTAVTAGSVGIAGEQTGIYPFDSPGGWNIIGRTPLPLFDPNRKEPVLLQPGDNVTFYPISEDAFKNYQSRTA